MSQATDVCFLDAFWLNFNAWDAASPNPEPRVGIFNPRLCLARICKARRGLVRLWNVIFLNFFLPMTPGEELEWLFLCHGEESVDFGENQLTMARQAGAWRGKMWASPGRVLSAEEIFWLFSCQTTSLRWLTHIFYLPWTCQDQNISPAPTLILNWCLAISIACWSVVVSASSCFNGGDLFKMKRCVTAFNRGLSKF